MLASHRRRSIWLGVVFLGIAAVIAGVTLFLLVTDYSLTDSDLLPGGNSQSSEQLAVTISATATADADVEPTAEPIPDPIDVDIALSARSAYVVHVNSGTELFDLDADEPLQPASTAKIFTALAVINHASPDEVIEIIEDDVVDPVEESSMGLQAGDRVTIHDLLVGLMLPSGNDAANALSRTIGERAGDAADLSADERFIQEMNDVAGELGLEASRLSHAAGHDRDDQEVTARELAIAAQALLERPSLQPIVAMKNAEIKVGGENERVISVDNTNELLIHEEVLGVKTGTTVEAGQCLVVAHRQGDDIVIAVILGSEDRYGDARALLDLPEPPEPDDDESAPDPEPGSEPEDSEN